MMNRKYLLIFFCLISVRAFSSGAVPMKIVNIEEAIIYSDGGSISIQANLVNNDNVNIYLDQSLDKSTESLTLLLDQKPVEAGTILELDILTALDNWITTANRPDSISTISKNYMENDSHTSLQLNTIVAISLISHICRQRIPQVTAYTEFCTSYIGAN